MRVEPEAVVTLLRRHVERLRSLQGGILGTARGSVPVSASRNGGFVPSSIPVIVSVPHRPTPNATGAGAAAARLQLPRFFRPGTLNATWESTVWNSEGATTWTQCVVDFPSGTTGDAAIDFDILVNGVVVESLTLGSAADQVEFGRASCRERVCLVV